MKFLIRKMCMSKKIYFLVYQAKFVLEERARRNFLNIINA